MRQSVMVALVPTMPGHDGTAGCLAFSQHSFDPARLTLPLLILGSAALRLAFAAALGLGVDESYMVAAGRVLSLGYYDHPPLAWWLSWGAAHLFGSEAAILVRLPFIALFALSTWLMYRLGSAIADRRAGLFAALLLNLSPVFGVTTGTWVLPDGPLDCALLAAALCLVNALDRGSLAWWFGAGLCAGLALLSKYSAALTVAGAILYLLTSRRHRPLLATAKPWLAALIASLMFAPVLAWNAAHGWESFAFQAGRAEGRQFHPLAPLVTLGGEALFVLPWIWLPMMAVLIAALRRGPGAWRPWLLSCLALPPIVVFAAVSAWTSQRVLFHWAAPGYLMLFPLLGDALARRIDRPAVRWSIAATGGFVILGVALVASQARLGWLHPLMMDIARSDPTVQAVDWTSLREGLPRDTLIGVPDWRNAGKIAYALGPRVTTICLSRDCRQFGLTAPAQRFIGSDLLILAPEHGDRVPDEFAGAFDRIEQLPDEAIRQAGRTLQTVAVFRADRLHAPPR
jgi:4-amino-4-deoxy-L-arabinose transferase-like glycosyltransferase